MADVSLTRRGRVAVAVVAVGGLVGYLHGGRSLFAVVLPLAVALAVTRFSTGRVERPTVTRRVPDFTTVGETESVDVRVEGTTWPVRAADTLPAGLDGDGTVVIADTEGTYTFTVAERGVHRIGPLYVSVGDPLGFWTRRFRHGRVVSLVAAPRIDRVDVPSLFGGRHDRSDDRSEFESVREYERGDPLRDVNWKASARRPGELVVTTYTGGDPGDEVTVVADPAGGDADDVATAAASIAVGLLDSGRPVALRTPSERVPPGTGDDQRRRLLLALARLDSGVAAGERGVEEAVLVRGTADGVTVRVGDATRPYSALSGESGAWENAFQP
ncbi:DUF58 domain-containing protein [Halospeciosus flavus]|uniref:DUF58 domain-containing protein n=1 Tax=Halospeciosus flavus TaxID=3032283 RepID=A0ABD5Z6N5_9EURY|nr:DUF58 domain-containing protein [Halospeciosus flavus]